jgi:hypothetical protein
MSLTPNKTNKRIEYPPKTIKRAKRALTCSPFNKALFEKMLLTSVALEAIALEKGKQQGYSKKPLKEMQIERELNWLIQVGLLRREVDGQGITDSFRLTPLGREVINTFDFSPPSLKDRVLNYFIRWFKLT